MVYEKYELVPLIVWGCYVTAADIRFTLNDQKGKQSLLVMFYVVEMRSCLALASVTSLIHFI